MALFTIEDLSFRYPETASDVLSDLSLSIESGTYMVLCGRSGCGKTTLLRQLKSVLTPYGQTRGRVLFDGRELAAVSLAEQSARIGFVMQNPDSQLVTDKVWHELAFGLESLGCDPETLRQRVVEMASYFGIQSWFHANTYELSGGQKQLLNLASILVMEPDVLVLDEPTAQLDPVAAADFLNRIEAVNKDLGVTVVLTEHHLETVVGSCDRLVVMEEGRIIADGDGCQVARQLAENHSLLMAAMPTPMRVFYGVAASDAKRGCRGFSEEPCPVTVREGRQWLIGRCGKQDPPLSIGLDDSTVNFEKPWAIEAKDLWFRYERSLPDVIKGADLQIGKNEIFALVGGNGSGKTTLLKLIDGVEKPYRGSLKILGKKIAAYSARDLHRDCLTMLPQDPTAILVKSTVYEELQEMLEGRGLQAQEREQRLEAIANLMDIQTLFRSHPFDLSVGEQQRVALAKALLTSPQILLLDEPTKGIDGLFKRQLGELLHRLKAQGVTIVMVSHDIEFCALWADRVGMFFDGALGATGTPRHFFSSNSFYTTAAHRMSRGVFADAITDRDVISGCESL